MNSMLEDELAFLERRASEELEMAQRATKTEVVAIHCRMADVYLERMADLKAASEASTEEFNGPQGDC